MTYVDWEKLAQNMGVGQVSDAHVANRLGLKNELWQRLNLSDKKAPECGANEGCEAAVQKENLGSGARWVDLIARAKPPYGSPVLSRKDLRSTAVFHDAILDAALAKAVLALQAQTGLDRLTVQEEVLDRLQQNRTALKSASSTIRFLRDASVSGDWFTDCSECGKPNDPGWSVCANCDFNKDG